MTASGGRGITRRRFLAGAGVAAAAMTIPRAAARAAEPAPGVLSGIALECPTAIAVTALGTLLAVDAGKNRVIEIDPVRGIIGAFGAFGRPVPGGYHFADDDKWVMRTLAPGEIEPPVFCFPMGIATADTGTVVVADTQNHRIFSARHEHDRGVPRVTVTRGFDEGRWLRRNEAGFDDGLFMRPVAVALGEFDTRVVADAGNRRIQILTLKGEIAEIIPASSIPEGIPFVTFTGVTAVEDTENFHILALDGESRRLHPFVLYDGERSYRICDTASGLDTLFRVDRPPMAPLRGPGLRAGALRNIDGAPWATTLRERAAVINNAEAKVTTIRRVAAVSDPDSGVVHALSYVTYGEVAVRTQRVIVRHDVFASRAVSVPGITRPVGVAFRKDAPEEGGWDSAVICGETGQVALTRLVPEAMAAGSERTP